MKKILCVLIGLLALASAMNVGAESIFGKNGLTDGTRDKILNAQIKEGVLVKDISDEDMIFKQYDLKPLGNYGVDRFSDYDGDFSKEFDYDTYYWYIPELQDGEVVNGYYVTIKNNGEVSKPTGPVQVKDGIGFAMFYPVEKIKEYNIGDIEVLHSFILVTPSLVTGAYVKTDKGEFIIPVVSDVGKYYNKYNEDKLELEVLKAYTADEFVEIYLKEIEGRKKYEEEMEEKQWELNNNRTVTYYDEKEGEAVTVRETIDKETGEVKQEKVDIYSDEYQNSQKEKEDDEGEDAEEAKVVKKDQVQEKEPKKAEIIELTAEQKAYELKKQKLFNGTENGYELDKTFTRAEAVAMLIRLDGKESYAPSKESDYLHRREHYE